MKTRTCVVVAVALCATASVAAAQRVVPPPIPDSWRLETGPVAPEAPRAGSSFAPDVALRLDPQPLPVAAPGDARWNTAFLGAVAGAVVGGLVGVWAERESSDRIGAAPPAYFVSIPLGAVVGFVAGLHLRGRP